MRRNDSQGEYLLTFASFYKSMYAKDRLRSKGIPAVPVRVPAGVFKTCSQGLYISCDDIQIAVDILADFEVRPKRIFKIIYVNGKREYIEI